MIADERFKVIYNKIIQDPDDLAAMEEFVHLARRLGRPLPEKIEEIIKLWQRNHNAIVNYILFSNLKNRSELAAQLPFALFRNITSERMIRKMKYIIENDNVGDPSEAAYKLCLIDYVEPLWVKKIIDNAVSGDPYFTAIKLYDLAEDHYRRRRQHSKIKGINREWLEKIQIKEKLNK